MTVQDFNYLYELLNYKFRRRNYGWRMVDDNHIVLSYNDYEIVITDAPIGMTKKSRPKGTVLAHGFYAYIKCPDRDKMRRDEKFNKLWMCVAGYMTDAEFWTKNRKKFYEGDVEPLF